VEDLELWIPEGTVYGFLGPNGAGKSTTMRMLTTLTTPTSGNATVAGHSIENRSELVEQIGYLPEEPPIHDELTAREQIEYVAGLREIPDDVAHTRIEELLERFDLAGDADRRISGYSKGMRQKTALIQAMIHEPAVLFLDEPTSGLDPRAARTVRNTITNIAAEDTTVFLSTHILPVVEELADMVGVLYEGRLVTEGAPDSLVEQADTGEGSTLEDVFLEVTGSEDVSELEESA